MWHGQSCDMQRKQIGPASQPKSTKGSDSRSQNKRENSSLRHPMHSEKRFTRRRTWKVLRHSTHSAFWNNLVSSALPSAMSCSLRSAVFLIIVTNNFGEIKSTVFKRYEASVLSSLAGLWNGARRKEYMSHRRVHPRTTYPVRWKHKQLRVVPSSSDCAGEVFIPHRHFWHRRALLSGPRTFAAQGVGDTPLTEMLYRSLLPFHAVSSSTCNKQLVQSILQAPVMNMIIFWICT